MLRSVSRGFGAAVAAAGALVLLGWQFDIGALKSVLPGMVSMKANAALCFLLAGAALYALNSATYAQNRRTFYATVAGASAVAAIGLLTLGQYLTDIDLGIDQLLFSEPATAIQTYRPGRMSLRSALLFALLGLGLVFLARRRAHYIGLVHALSFVALLVSLTSVAGYVHGAGSLYRFGEFTAMALHSAVLFSMLAVGMLCARAEQGWVTLIVSDGPGGVAIRQLWLPSVAALLLLAWLNELVQQAGFLSNAIGSAMQIVLGIVMLSGIVWKTAASLEREEHRRARAEVEGRKLFAELRRFRVAMDASGNGVALTDRASLRYVDVNQTLCDMLGYSKQELLGMTPADVTGVSRETLERDYGSLIADNESSASRVEIDYRRKDGSLLPVEVRRRALHTGDGWIIVGVSHDITARKQADERIRRLNRVYAVLSGINSLIVRARDRDELFREACRIAVTEGKFKGAWLGMVDREAMRVKPVASYGVDDAFIQALPLGSLSVEVAEPAANMGMTRLAVIGGVPVFSEDMETDPRVWLRKEARERGFRSHAIVPLLVAGEVVGVLSLYAAETNFFDAAEMKLLTELAGDIAFAVDHIEKQNQIEYLALHDSLTGLANRRLFDDRLGQNLRIPGRGDTKLALAILNVERFKTINDSLGRQAGDELLRELAGRLALAAGKSRVARVGADQFAVLLPAVKGRSAVARGVERIWRECFAQPFRLGDAQLRISAKTGMALHPADGADGEALFASAEAALRKAQETGERHQFHTRALTEGVAAQLTLENQLRQALDREEFVLHYQPKVDTETRAIVGVEALIRWQSPELGLVPPAKFIPLLEETGMILEAGSWALQQAARDHRKWFELGLKPPRVAVNVSPIQLRQRDFVAAVERAIMEGLAPTGIDLEITESLVMEDVQGSIEKLKAARDLGLRIAIDDFGTGYSSLGYLAKLPVQTLKIDRSFIITMLGDPDTMTLVSTIIQLAHSLRLQVVAEGVDKEEQAKLLRLLRCDQMQGYLYSKPLPFEQMTALLRQPATAR